MEILPPEAREIISESITNKVRDLWDILEFKDLNIKHARFYIPEDRKKKFYFQEWKATSNRSYPKFQYCFRFPIGAKE